MNTKPNHTTTPPVLKCRRKSDKVRFSVQGVERYCSACKDWHPPTPEYWHLTAGHLRNECKACYHDYPSQIARDEQRYPALRKETEFRKQLPWLNQMMHKVFSLTDQRGAA